MENFTRVVAPTVVKIGRRIATVFCKIKWEDGRLSITGVEGPKSDGNAIGGCGQIDITKGDPAAGWTRALVERFAQVWQEHHLNDLKAGCEHQRAAKWNERPIDPSKPLNAYGRHTEGQTIDCWNMLTWVTRKQHPQGLLSEPCPECGYKYGSAWLRAEVPEDALEFLASLPEAATKPAWV